MSKVKIGECMNDEEKHRQSDETEHLNISDETRDEMVKFFLRTSVPRVLKDKARKI